jgi:hypothetical protein
MKSSNIEITLHKPDAVSPVLVGFNNDECALGFAVHTIKLTE